MPNGSMKVSLRRCGPADLETLREIARETYDDTFRSMNRPEVMDAYLEEAFDPSRLAAELANPAAEFWFLFLGDEPGAALAGYLKVNDAPAQSDLNDPRSLEVERIYVRRAYQGRGLGRILMEHAESLARERGRATMWLGVWEKNTEAISFYGKLGFRQSGRHSFRMGDELQSDLVMSRAVGDRGAEGERRPLRSSPEGQKRTGQGR